MGSLKGCSTFEGAGDVTQRLPQGSGQGLLD